MAEQLHTPGPWGELETESSVDLEFPDGGRVSGWQDVGTADGHVVAIVVSKDTETYRDGDGVAEANSRLICAAPDLFSAAGKMVSVLSIAPDDQIECWFGPEILSAMKALREARNRASGELK